MIEGKNKVKAKKRVVQAAESEGGIPKLAW